MNNQDMASMIVSLTEALTTTRSAVLVALAAPKNEMLLAALAGDLVPVIDSATKVCELLRAEGIVK